MNLVEKKEKGKDLLLKEKKREKRRKRNKKKSMKKEKYGFLYDKLIKTGLPLNSEFLFSNPTLSEEKKQILNEVLLDVVKRPSFIKFVQRRMEEEKKKQMLKKISGVLLCG